MRSDQGGAGGSFSGSGLGQFHGEVVFHGRFIFQAEVFAVVGDAAVGQAGER